MKKPVYIKCPRCELNYILKRDKLCDVCKAEMKAGALNEDDDDDFMEDEDGLELCPICKVNYLSEGESICSSCQEEQASIGNADGKSSDGDWKEFVEKPAAEEEDEDLDLLPQEDDIDEELQTVFKKDLDEDFSDDDIESDEEVEPVKDGEEDIDFDEDGDEDEEDEDDDIDDEDEDDDIDYEDDDDSPKPKNKKK